MGALIVSHSLFAIHHCLIMHTDKLDIQMDGCGTALPKGLFCVAKLRKLAWIPQAAMTMNASLFSLIAVTWPRMPQRLPFLTQLDIDTHFV